MTPEQYIDSECKKFTALCEEVNYTAEWNFSYNEIAQLDIARDAARDNKWPDGTPPELGNSIAILWGSVFSLIMANTFTSKWSVDPQSKIPIVLVKCGQQAIQVKTILLGAQAFNDGTLFADLAKELFDHLIKQGAELKDTK